MYKNAKEADHAFYMRHRDRFRQKRAISPNNHRDRFRQKRAISPNNGHHPLPSEYVEAVGRTLIGTDMLPPARVLSLKEVLVNAAGGNVDREADVLTISALLDKEADHAFYMRHRDRFRQKRAISPNNGHHPLPSDPPTGSFAPVRTLRMHG
jgi:hypothetical protein